MNKLNDILHELGISKVKLAKYLGVSRQMIYNYLELDDLNKWPKDKKVLLLNLLGIKDSGELDTIKVNTDYIMDVENRLNSLIDEEGSGGASGRDKQIFNDLGKKQKEVMMSIVDLMKEMLEDPNDMEAYYTFKYMYNFMQSIETSRELRYMLAYVAKAAGFVKPLEFVFNEEEQFAFESIMYSAMVLYNNRANTSEAKLAESHKRFINQIEHKMEDKLSRTMELNTIRVQALKELGYTSINEDNAAEVFEKIAEIQSRKVTGV